MVDPKPEHRKAGDGQQPPQTHAPGGAGKPADKSPPDRNAQNPKKSFSERRKRRECREWARFGVEVLTLLVLSVYTGVSFQQWRAVIRSNSLTESSISLSNRAWLIVKTISPLPPFSKDTVFRLILTVENTGKSPAFNLTGSNAAIVVNDPGPITGEPTIVDPAEVITRGVIGNGHVQEITLRATHFTAEQIEAITGRGAKYVALGRLKYDDPLGVGRETLWCLFYENSVPKFQFCPVHNAVH